MSRQLPIAALLLACATSGATAPASALDLPARKPGLWEMKMTFEGRNLPTQVSQHCIDAETDKQMSALGGNMRRDMCEKQDVTNTGGTIVVDSVCKIGAATTTSHGVISGDFSSAYTVKVSSKREGGPAMPGAAGDGTSNMTIEAKWLGACQADQKPGDMILANGRKLNIRDMPNLQQGLEKIKGLQGLTGARPPAPK
jgi:Protein of unknown function (DUF3617)